jgi:predicted DNA-binding transcriptional regulator AlpA
MQVVGYKASAFHQKVKDGLLPKPVRLGPNAVGWYQSELLEYIRNLPRAA